MTAPVRAVAASLLNDVAQGSSLNKIYSRAEQSVADSEQPLLRELVYGSLRLWPLYKGVTRQLLERPYMLRAAAACRADAVAACKRATGDNFDKRDERNYGLQLHATSRVASGCAKRVHWHWEHACLSPAAAHRIAA